MDEIAAAIRGMPNRKDVGTDSPPSELPEFFHPQFMSYLLPQPVCRYVENGRRPPAVEICKWKYATIKVLHTKRDRSDCNNCRGIAIVAHSGNVLVKIVASRLISYCEPEGILPGEQCGFRPARSTVDMLFVVRPLQELGRARGIPLYVCFIDLQIANYSVDRELCCG